MIRTRPLRARIALVQMLLLFGALPAFGQQRALQPQDSYLLKSIGDVALSPTAAYVAYTVTTTNEKDNDRSTAIWLQQLRDGRPVGDAVRFTDPTRNSSSPAWSPDGSVLAFSSRRGDEDGSTWFIRVGSIGGEAYRIEGVRGTPSWSPDGSAIAFTAEPPEEKRPSAKALRVAPDALTKPLDAERFDGYVITHRRYKRDGTFTFVPHPGHSAKRQLWVVAATGGEARQVTNSEYNVGSFEWSPDGSYFVYSMNPEEDNEMSFDPSGSIWVVPAAGGEPRRAVALPGGQGSPAISPDGSKLAFLHTPAWNSETYLMVADIDRNGAVHGTPRNLTESWGRTAGSPRWTPDGRSIRWASNVNASTNVYEVSAAGGDVRQITSGERVLGDLSVSADGRMMAYTSTDPVRPGDVYLADGSGRNETRVTAVNDSLLGHIARPPAERITWRVRDGTEVEGWVIKPVGYTPGTRYPMVLNIHGGPHGAFNNSFSSSFHVLSGAGFFVFYLNPRGSTGYGNDFKHAIHAAWGLVDEEDFITGVETVLRAYPDIDRTRLGVTGGSYGGFMSNWLTARTDLFAASVTRASISSWEAMAGTTDSNQPHRAFDGAYHEQRDIWRRNSPISYVENVRAPTLVIHGENDFRTPLSEGQMWYGALKKLGVPTEFVVYPRSGHGIREPWLAADVQERTRQWLVYWLIENPGRVRADQ